MSPVPSVLVVSQDGVYEEYAVALRAEGLAAQTVGSYSDALSYLERLAPGADAQTVAVVDGDLSQDVAFQIYKLLHSTHQVPTLTLVDAERFQQFVLDPHRPPADEYAVKPVGVGELCLRVKAMVLRAGYELPAEPFSDSGAGRRDGIHHGSITVVFSPKGGIGKSTVAVNVAVALSKFFNQKTLLVDADLWFGDVGVLLNFSSRRSIFDIASEDEPSLSVLEQALVQHSSGVHLLLRPPDLSTAENIRAEGVVRAIASYRALFDHVIVDTHSALDEMNLQVLDAADRILLITTPEISAVHHTSRFLEISSALGLSSRITLVLNRSNSGIRLAALEEQLGLPIAGTIVSNGKVVVEAANHGVSLFDRDPSEEEEVTRNLIRVAELVAGHPRSVGHAGDREHGTGESPSRAGRGSGGLFRRGGSK